MSKFQLDAEVGRDMQLLTEENKRLSRELGRVKRREASIIAEVRAALRDLPDVKPPPIPKADSRKLDEEVAWLFLSDTQIGKVTPTYNVRVAEKRILACADTLCRLTELRRSAAKLDRCVLILGGDMVEGEGIFASQPYEIEIGAMQQSVQSAPQAFARAIRTLASAFNHVDIRCVVGNHGRLGLIMGPTHPLTNWDRVCYEVTQMLVQDLKNVDFKISADFWWHEDVLGHGQLVVHGDQIQGSGTDGPLARAAMGWIDSMEYKWEILWMGHFHNPRYMAVNKRIVIVNGTTESSNLYAKRKLKAEGFPMQWAGFFGRKHGLLALVPVYLE